MDMVWNLFFMFGGVAVMMFGMKIMGSALEKIASGGMKKMLGRVTSNRFAGVGIGLAVTSIIQSSTATTVMLVGFVNIGLMTLVQATNVIMGANIGTTVTAHIVSLSEVADVGAIAAFVGFIGVMMAMLIKNEKAVGIGNILGGLGLIFVGLEFISTYAKLVMFVDGKSVPFDWVASIFQQDHFPLLLILIGIVLTAFVHSSSTITSLMVVLAGIGVLSFDNALFLALGSNIGTCVTSIMSSMGTQVNAKRTAVVHLLFNTFGCLIFLAPLWIWKGQVGAFFGSIAANVGQQIAIFHTAFNVITTLILLPFSKHVVKLACLIVREKESDQENKYKFAYIDTRMLETASIAASNTKKEIIRMSELAKENINYAMDMLMDNSKDNSAILEENEDVINHLNKNIVGFLTKLMHRNLNEQNEKKIGTYYHVVSDIERIGDYAENIMEYSIRLKEEGLQLSEGAKNELNEFRNKINSLYDNVVVAFDERDLTVLPIVEGIEEEIDNLCVELEHRHIDRLKKSECTAQTGSVFLQTISNLERVGDHMTNVAFSIKQYTH